MDRSCTVSGSIGGALLVALLLTGCSGEDDGAEASPSSTASSADSSTASAGATADGPASPAPSAEATSAEYVPASLEGPARNVPKPVMPELAKEESRAGAQAFLDYWSDAMWYANQTGDTSYVREIVSNACETCTEQFEVIEDVYRENAWFVGGRERIRLQDLEIRRAADGVYKPIALSSSEGIKLVEDGRITYESHPRSGSEDPFPVYLDYGERGWVYITAANMSGVGETHE